MVEEKDNKKINTVDVRIQVKSDCGWCRQVLRLRVDLSEGKEDVWKRRREDSKSARILDK